jgi:glycosyltransferase involved in cell wall biosynthesis
LKKAAIITAFDPFAFKGGIEIYTSRLAELLKDHDVHADIYHSGMVKADHSLHNDYLGRLYLTGRKVFESGVRYDLVIANSFYGLGYFPPQVKTFNIFHATHMGFAERIKDAVPLSQYLEWKLLWGGFSEAVSGFGRTKIAVSESVRDELAEHYGFSDAVVVPNGVDTHVFSKQDKALSRIKLGIPEDSFVGLYVGRWDILKGSDILERIMATMRDVEWIVVLGTGSDKNKVPAGKGVHCIDQVQHEYMSGIYSAADFLLFPSRYEGFGYVIIEAMACELPVITTDVGIARTICRQEPFDRFLLPGYAGGAEEIVQSALKKIEHLRAHGGWRECLAKAGRAVIEREFGITRWDEDMVEVMEL